MPRERYQVNPTQPNPEWTGEEFQRVSLFLEKLSQAKTEYQQEYVPGDCYTEGDIITGGGYLFIAKKDTCENPIPVPIGDSTWIMPQLPAWNIHQINNIVYTGMRISGTVEAYQMQAIRAWLQNVTENQQYRLYIYDVTTDILTPYGNSFNGTVLSAPGWFEYKGDPSWIYPGDDKALLLVQQNVSASTDYNESYVYQGVSNQETDPGLGNAYRRGDHVQLRINATDRLGTDRYSELQTVVTGALIKVSSEENASAYIQYEVTGAIVDNLTWFNYGVTLVDTGAAGEPGPAVDVQIYFEVPVATPTDYVELPDYFIPNPNLSGYKKIGTDGTPEYNQHGYGVDIVIQRFDRSEDYDIIGGGTGGSGQTTEVYDYVKVKGILDIGDVYQQVASLTTSNSPAGVYELKFALTWHLSVANKSSYFRWRETDEQGVFSGWNEAISEPSDTTDVQQGSYFYPVEWNGGAKIIEVEMRKEDALGQLDLNFLDVIWDSKRL